MRLPFLVFSLCYGFTTALRYNVLMQRPDPNDHTETNRRLADGSNKDMRRNIVRAEAANKIDAEVINLPLDHWDTSAGTFPNRFWVNEEFYKPGGPVIIFDAGEGNASESLSWLTHPKNSILVQMIREFNGMGILWEHRYYGESTPVKINSKTPATAFKYLDTEQALADVPAFAWNFTRKNFPEQDLTPASIPWVFLGGSYPGMRAAFVRHAYPETIFASYASSAPVQASIDMSFYFEPVWQGMQAKGVSGCALDIKTAIQEMDNMLDDDEKSFALKEKFLGVGAGNNTNAGFADALTTIFNRWQGGGLDGDGDGPGLGEFCEWISTDPETKQKSGPLGWAASKGPQYTIDRWASWAPFLKIVNHDMKITCAGPIGKQASNSSSTLSTRDAKTCDLEARYEDPAAISWTWQYCSQWGFLQSANLGPHQLVSKHNSLTHQHEICHRQFPDGLSTGALPLWPDVDSVNDRYKGWDIRPSNTFWGGGQFDPWRTLSPLSDMWFSPKNAPVQTVPKCAKSDAAEDADVFGYVLKDGEHCFDMYPWVAGSDQPRNLFVQALREWMGCFVPGKRSPNSQTAIRTVQYS